MRTFVLLAVMLAFGATGLVNAQCSEADKAALKAFDLAWGEAGRKGDRAALANIYADDYMSLPDMEGKAAAIDNTVRTAERNRANPATAETVSHDHYIVNCSANSATVTHRNTISVPMGAGGKPETFYSRSVHVLEKRGGKWQVVSNAGHDLDDYAVLWYLEQDWNNAFWKKDAEWFKKNFADDFSSISSTTAKLDGKADELASLASDKSTYDLVKTSDMNINIEGNTARITGIFHLRGKDEKGVAFDNKIRYTDIWVKRDGRWVAWSSQGTRMP
jgi:ketosteroid isomerase-like protein